MYVLPPCTSVHQMYAWHPCEREHRLHCGSEYKAKGPLRTQHSALMAGVFLSKHTETLLSLRLCWRAGTLRGGNECSVPLSPCRALCHATAGRRSSSAVASWSCKPLVPRSVEDILPFLHKSPSLWHSVTVAGIGRLKGQFLNNKSANYWPTTAMP